MKNIEILKKYLKNSTSNMSAYGKHHIYRSDFSDIELPMNSGTFEKLNYTKLIKYYFSLIFQLIIFGKKILLNDFVKRYKLICKLQSRLFNQDLIYHSIVLNLLQKQKILEKGVCVIGDGKANFVHGILNLEKISKIYSVNLPQSLIQDYIILTRFNSIDENLIKIVDVEKDLYDERCKLFLIPAQNKNFLIGKDINLFVNTFSFQEMPLKEVHEYINIAKLNRSYLYSLNREQKKMYDDKIISYDEYGLNNIYQNIFKEEAKFVRYRYSIRFPFIHKKKSKVIHSLTKFN